MLNKRTAYFFDDIRHFDRTLALNFYKRQVSSPQAYTACHINVPKKDGGISVVAKSVPQSERFFNNHYKIESIEIGYIIIGKNNGLPEIFLLCLKKQKKN
ncbi:MAG: hypothetical protein PVI00_18445 [Desulfobacterales bacterium]|jgi:hypothetical protein